MSELTNGAYAEIQKGVKGIKTYLKFSRLDAYAMMKLMQFIKRAAKYSNAGIYRGIYGFFA